MDEIERLRRALITLMGFRAHKRHCEIEETDFCTCGMKDAADQARHALDRSGS